KTGLTAHSRAHQQRGLEQTVQHRSRQGLGDVPGVAHLPLNLRLAEDHRIETRRNAVQVPHRVPVALDAAALAGAAPAALPQALREECPYRCGDGVVGLGQVELGAVARREQDTAPRSGRQHPLERARHLARRVGEALAHLEGCRTVIHAQDRDAHDAVAQRNRSVPGAVSLSARYTSSTAAKLAMLANAARRPAQCRTRRTPTVHPSTTHMCIPHTTCPSSTGTPPASRPPTPTPGRASVARPMSRARPMRHVASGPVKTPTADARNAASLATWNSARNSASMDSVGATPMNGVSRATPSACATMPASGTPKSRPRGAGRSPAKGASTNTVATAYRPRATK